ncbi:MAG TPA: YncE family protein [Gemmataceae bacterium]|nr:YncE family protein [Gemmataceae bacterium]
MSTLGRRFGVLVGFLFLLVGWNVTVQGEESGYHVLKTFAVGGEGGWDYLTMDSAARRLYISRATRVQVLDVEKGTVVGEIPNTSGVHGIAIAPKLDRGYTSNGRDGTVTVFDLKTLKELERIKVGQGPDAILFDPASGRVFTFNGRGQDATAIDAATGKVAGTVKLGGKPEAGVSDEQGTIYVNIENKNEIIAFDAKDLTVKHHWPVAPGTEPAGLAIDRSSRRLFATCHNQKMVILDADSGKVIDTPTIGKGTDACVFDPASSLAFSSNGDGTLTLVHEDAPDKFSVVANVPTRAGARTMALDSETHNILLATAKAQATPATGKGGGGRRSFVPGSFVILVVGK